MSEVREITSNEFQEFINTPTNPDELAVVQFRADWCGPCRILHKHLEGDIDSLEASGKVKVATLNVDSAAEITSKYNIRGIPTVFFFRNGELLQEQRKGPTLQTVKDAISALTTDQEDDF